MIRIPTYDANEEIWVNPMHVTALIRDMGRSPVCVTKVRVCGDQVFHSTEDTTLLAMQITTRQQEGR